MPTSQINAYRTPESTGSPVIHEDLANLVEQMMQGDVMRFANSTERTAVFTTLGSNPPVGALSYLIDADRYERWGGSAWGPFGLPNGAALSNVTGAGTTTSGSYANLPAVSSFSFTKLGSSTGIIVAVNLLALTTVANTQLGVAVQINGTDYDIGANYIMDANLYRYFAGVNRVSGVPAGTHTIQVRWKRVAGIGTLTVDANTYVSASAIEVA